jgi:hypothetical protein
MQSLYAPVPTLGGLYLGVRVADFEWKFAPMEAEEVAIKQPVYQFGISEVGLHVSVLFVVPRSITA